MSMTTQTQTRRSCNAIIRVTAGEWNLEPVECGQVVGIKSYESTRNGRVGFCSRPGHELSVRGRFAEKQDPPEPEWDLPDGPDHADSMICCYTQFMTTVDTSLHQCYRRVEKLFVLSD